MKGASLWKYCVNVCVKCVVNERRCNDNDDDDDDIC